MNTDFQQLTNRVQALENMVNGRSAPFEEKIRDIITYDIDNLTTTTQVITIPAGGGSATVSKNPNTYLRIKFRGKIYNIPAYTL